MCALKWIVVPVTFYCFSFASCSPSETLVREPSGVIAKDHQDPSPTVQESVIILTHDFGVIQPKSRQQCSFDVSNPSTNTWTVSHLHTSCRCTVAEVSQEVIPPGGSIRVDLGYRPPDEVTDDRRSVSLLFKEGNTPVVQLVISAKIRESLTVMPNQINHVRVSHGQVLQGQITISNYAREEISPPSVRAEQDWIRLESIRIEKTKEKGENQRWVVPYSIDTGLLTSGIQGSGILVTSDKTSEKESKTCRIPIDVSVTPPIEAIPGRLFFRDVSPGKSSKVTFIIRQNEPQRSSEVTIEHNLMDQLTIVKKSQKGNDTVWEATLSPRSDATEIQGKVTVKLHQSNKVEIELPVIARVLKDEKP